MIRKLLIFFLCLLPVNAAAIIEYQLDVRLQPAEQKLTATALITPDDTIDHSLELRLAERCELITVHQAGNELNFSFEHGILKLELVNRAPILISYRGQFDDPVSSTPIHNEDPSYGVSAVISASGVFLSAAANWYPRLDSEAIHYLLSVTAPADLKAVSSGRRLEHYERPEQSYSVWAVDYPLYGLTLSAGPYQVFEDLSGEIPIYAYFYADSAQLAPVYLQESRNYLTLYQQLFGPYPFDKFAIVENFFPTGYGFPSWTLLGSSVIRLPFIVKTSLGHEIAHSWWGTGVRVDYSQGNWAEGLTTYVADYLYLERSSPEEAHEYRLKVLREYAELVNSQNAFPVSEFLSRNDKASQSIGYGKAALLFHMLRKKLGDAQFWAVLNKIAREKMFQPVSWNDFAEQFSAGTDQDLSVFFEQWLHRTDGPVLALKDVKTEKTTSGYLIRGIVEQTKPVYQLNIELQLTTTAGVTSIPLEMSGATQGFALQTAALPLELLADPGTNLFRILTEEELPPTINAIRASSKLLAVSAEHRRPSQLASKTLLGALRKSDLPLTDLAELTPEQLESHDLLIFGTSEKLQPGILDGGKMILAGEEIDIEGKSAFVVLPHPKADNRVVAWFIADGSEDSAVVASKIPHYGKYSYVVFDGENNQLKGTFSPEKSPLRVELSELSTN